MKVLTFEQYSPAWWAARRGVPTASEFSRICTHANGALAEAHKGYAAELIGQAVDSTYGHEQDYVSAAMQAGISTEPTARAWYEFDTGITVQQVGFCLTDDGRFGSSPDALAGEDGVLELKSPLPKTHILWLLGGALPNEHKVQCHGHLVVTGRAWCDFTSYVEGLDPLRVRVVRDAFTEKLAARLDEFWTAYQEMRAKVKVTPIPFAVPDEPERMTEEEALANAFGAVRRTVTVDPIMNAG